MANFLGTIRTDNQAMEFEDLSKQLTTVDWEDTILTSRVIGDGVATDDKVFWEEDADTRVVNAASEAATITAGETTITVKNSTDFTAGDIVFFQDAAFEVARVTDVSGNVLTLTRGWGDSTASSHASTVNIQIIGNALVEGADTFSANNTTRVKASNTVQIFSTAISISKTKRWTQQPGGRELSIQTIKKMREHKKFIESAVIWGSKSDRSSTNPGTMGGIVEILSSNLRNEAGTLTKTDLDTFLRGIFENKGNTDFLLSGSLGFQAINNFPSAGFPMQQSGISFGARFETYIGPFGKIPVAVSRLIRSGDLLALQSEHLRFRWGVKPRLERLPDLVHAERWVIQSEVSLERRHESTHGLNYGITG